MSGVRAYHAVCACGAVHFLVETDPASAMPCICVRCRGQGLRIAHGAAESFRVITGADHLTENFAEARTPHHFFCRTCGEAVFGRNRLPDGGETVSVNVACLDRSDRYRLAEDVPSETANPDAPDAQWQAK